MSPLDNLFGNPVQRIDAIIGELFPRDFEDIRREKACVIEDILRGCKIAQLYDVKIRKAINNENIVQTFDSLYDMGIDVLRLHSLSIDMKNTYYMRGKVEEHNRADWNKKDSDFWR